MTANVIDPACEEKRQAPGRKEGLLHVMEFSSACTSFPCMRFSQHRARLVTHVVERSCQGHELLAETRPTPEHTGWSFPVLTRASILPMDHVRSGRHLAPVQHDDGHLAHYGTLAILDEVNRFQRRTQFHDVNQLLRLASFKTRDGPSVFETGHEVRCQVSRTGPRTRPLPSPTVPPRVGSGPGPH